MFIHLTDFKDENKRICITGEDTLRAAVVIEVPAVVIGEESRSRTTLFCADDYTFDVRETPEEIEKLTIAALLRAREMVEGLIP